MQIYYFRHWRRNRKHYAAVSGIDIVVYADGQYRFVQDVVS